MKRVLAGVLAVAMGVGWSRPAVAAEPVVTEPVATEPVQTEPAQTEPAVTEPAPDTIPRGRQPGDRMVGAGVGMVVVGLVGYGLMVVGLAIGNGAESALQPLSDREDIDRRRDVLARGRLGNRLAIAGAVTATVAVAVGIPLIVIGRRRHEASIARAAIGVGGVAGGYGLRVRGRF